MNEDEDRRRVQRTALSIGLYVGVASALAIAIGVGILITVILLNRRAESSEGPGEIPGGHGRGDDFVIDADRLLPVVLTLGLLGVVLLGAVAWFAARRSVGPLAEALRLQRNFVADASHELRTPLTTLSSRIQLLQRRQQRGEPIDESVEQLRADAAMMADVLDDLLLAAEGGAGGPHASSSLDEAVGIALESLRPLAEEAGVGVAVEVSPDAVVGLRTVTLVRLLIALIDHAVQHSPTGTTVSVGGAVEGRMVSIRVSDHGSGIRGIEPDAVFERFARSAESGRRRSFGIGLSLVRDVAARAGGSVVVESTSGEGATFLLRLPVAR